MQHVTKCVTWLFHWHYTTDTHYKSTHLFCMWAIKTFSSAAVIADEECYHSNFLPLYLLFNGSVNLPEMTPLILHGFFCCFFYTCKASLTDVIALLNSCQSINKNRIKTERINIPDLILVWEAYSLTRRYISDTIQTHLSWDLGNSIWFIYFFS